MKKFLIYIVVSLTLFSFSCNTKTIDKVKFSGETQGTYYAITYYDWERRNFQTEIDSLLELFDQTASIWEKNSVISRINNQDSSITPNDDFIALFNKSKEIYELSNKSFDPTVGPLVNAWGFGFTDRMEVDQTIVDSLLPFIGFDKVQLKNNKIIKSDPRIQFDFNAIAQGYSVDLIGAYLTQKGIKAYLIDIGGEVLAKGLKPEGEKWTVGIEKPKDNAQYGESLQAIVELHNKAMATSGNYRKFYEKDGVKYSHTINPKNGFPVQHSMLSVSVIADDCATADAWATAFMVMGIENSIETLAKDKSLDAYFIYSGSEGNMQTYATSGLGKMLVNID